MTEFQSAIPPTSSLRLAMLATLALFCAAPVQAFEEWHDTVGYTKLKSTLGSSVPLGTGVMISQVEAVQGTNSSSDPYFVDPNFVDDKPTSLPEFTGVHDPHFNPENPGATAITFINATSSSRNAASLHTNRVGARFYGDASSISPGANTVVIYEATNWMSSVLNYDASPGDSFLPGPPIDPGYRVQNHSWIGSLSTESNAAPWTEDVRNVDVLRRLDYWIETANGGQGTLVAVGLNNGQTPMPFLLAHSYNAISVGRSDGFHSAGLTRSVADAPNFSYGPGRSKPDIVAPRPAPPPVNIQTSFSTPMVASAATLLYSAVGGTDAMNSEVIKSMLMAGATKNEFPTWTRTPEAPLDEVYGAGELNVYNSYLMTAGGRGAGSASQPTMAAPSFGWDYQNLKGNTTAGDRFYNFHIPTGSTATELSIVLNWNVKVTDTDPGAPFLASHSLQNLDMALFNSTIGFLDTMLDQSISTVDNAEHIFRTNLGPGTYTLKVSGAANWDYGLAWRMSTLFDTPSADFDQDGSVTGSDFLVWQRNLGILVGALPTQGDADGDGDVDRDDLAIYSATVTIGPIAGAPNGGASASPGGVHTIAGVPEPTTGILAAVIGILGAAATRRLRRKTC